MEKIHERNPFIVAHHICSIWFITRNFMRAKQILWEKNKKKFSLPKNLFVKKSEIRNRPLFSQLRSKQSARQALMWPLSTGWYCCQPHHSKPIPQHSSEHIIYSSFHSNPISSPSLTEQATQTRSVCSPSDFAKSRKYSTKLQKTNKCKGNNLILLKPQVCGDAAVAKKTCLHAIPLFVFCIYTAKSSWIDLYFQ